MDTSPPSNVFEVDRRPRFSASDCTTLLHPARDATVAVVGLGYVGLPTAVAFANAGLDVVGYDIDLNRLAELERGIDRTLEVSPLELGHAQLSLCATPAGLAGADVFIVAVPTPLAADGTPDLGPLLQASAAIGAVLAPGAMVVYESTVYPGTTETACIPVLERACGLIAGQDFEVAYSPERANPGDRVHRLGRVAKIAAAQTLAGLDRVARLYGQIVPGGVHRAPSIRVAEAAKVVENAQRDVNIAFVNELARMFDRMSIDTQDVLAAAGTKWNFAPFSPGLVGGHCIGIDTSYLIYKAECAGYDPALLKTARRVNDDMADVVARRCIRLVMTQPQFDRRVTVLGVTFKEGTPDLRNSRTLEVVQSLQEHGLDVQLADPLADSAEVERLTGMALTPLERLRPSRTLLLAVAHEAFVLHGWALVRRLLPEGGSVLDVKGVLDRDALPPGITLWRL